MPPQHLEKKTALAARLRAEGRPDLAEPIEDCGDPVRLTCTHCGNEKEGHTHCDRKYCPSCSRALAAARCAKIRNAVCEFRWPLFVTLTVRNSPDPESVRELRKAFGALRRRVAWSRTVQGGVASIEVTNKGNGWHPHLHALIDCRWLAIHTPEPTSGMTADIQADLCGRAAAEFGALWSKVSGTDNAQAYIRRTAASDVVQEVLKYALKADELLEVTEPLGPLIDVLSATRLVTTFGTLYGRGKEFEDAADPEKPTCSECGETSTFVPPAVLHFYTR